jgi:NAD(P)-dependent dehydrogenase (short-subunit alcohol dehydrogenase family)
MAWTAADIPSQSGRTIVVTGATSEIGHHTALELARAGAELVLAVRDTARGEDVRAQTGAAAVLRLDLADLASKAAYDEAAARRLWDVSEQLSGVRYP